nr:hypothetical protein [Tanacetum cinerariifolium]
TNGWGSNDQLNQECGQPLPRVTQVSIDGTTSTEQPPLKDKSMWSDQEKRIQKIDRLARSLLVQGLLNDIYSLIDSNKTAKNLWDSLARHMLGSEYGDVNDVMGSKKKTVVVTSNPLALIDEKIKVCKSKEKVVVSSDFEGSDADDFNELKKIAALLAKAFNRRKFYSKPTNNNLRTSSTSQSANKKQVFVKSDDKKVEKKADEKKRDMSKVKCYNYKKEGHFAKDCKKVKKKMLHAKKDKDEQVLLAEDQAWMESKTSSSSADEKIYEKCGYSKDNYELNFKFLNNLQPEWKQYATMMRQNKNLMDINIDNLYNILKQTQGDVNDVMGSKKKTVVVTSNPLALIDEKIKSANKKQVFVKSDDKKVEKKADEKKRDMSKVKCYNCKKEGHFAKDCKKVKVKDYEYYKTKMLHAKKDKDEQVLLAKDQAWMDQEINANMVFMAQIEKVLFDSETSSSSADEKIYEVSYYLSKSKSESEFKTSEYYDNSTNYGLFVNNDDD